MAYGIKVSKSNYDVRKTDDSRYINFDSQRRNLIDYVTKYNIYSPVDLDFNGIPIAMQFRINEQQRGEIGYPMIYGNDNVAIYENDKVTSPLPSYNIFYPITPEEGVFAMTIRIFYNKENV